MIVSKEEFLQVMATQPEKEWHTLGKKFYGSTGANATCPLYWSANKIIQKKMTKTDKVAYLPFSEEELYTLYELNDTSKTMKEAHRRIREYVRSL